MPARATEPVTPTYSDLLDACDTHGVTLDTYEECYIQGVVIAYSRPVRDGESFMGLAVAGPRVESEVIERHYCSEVVAPPQVMSVTIARAIQRVLWQLDQEDEDAG